MTATRRFHRRSAAVAAVVTATLATAGVAMAHDDTRTAPAAEVQAAPRDDASVLPEGVRDGSRLFITKFRSVVVNVDDNGDISLIEPTGWDSCYYLHEDIVVRYPC